MSGSPGSQTRIAFYAMGGGLGHGVRALALARALLRLHPGTRVRVWAPARLEPFAAWAEVALDSPPEEPRPVRASLGAWVEARLDGFRPDLLVVDTFPRGVLGEIPPGGPPRVLTVRWGRRGLYEAPGPAVALTRDYAGILACEAPPAPLEGDPRLRRVGPVTLLGPADLVPREAARRALGYPGVEPGNTWMNAGRRAVGAGSAGFHPEPGGPGAEGPLVLVLGTGPPQAQAAVMAALQGLPARVVLAGRDLPGGLGLAPAAPWRLGADAVVAASGYASWHEVAMSGVPAVFLPQRRPLDDQALRASGALGARPSGPWWVVRRPSEVAGALSEVLREPPGPVQEWDGAEEGARLLSAW